VAHDHRLTLVPGPPVRVIGDAGQLAQVAHNLVRNALAHTPAGTTVVISTRAKGSMGSLEVSDDGPGIPPAEAERVFDRFYQRDPSRSASGAGLGLAIVRATAEALGGTARIVETGRPGATFVFSVPLAPDQSSAAGDTASPPVASPGREARSGSATEPRGRVGSAQHP
jgi:two-component system OmpR family sensor kinase